MEELLTQRIQSLTPEFRSFVLGDYIPKITIKFSEEESLPANQAELLQHHVTLFVLAFYDTDGLVDAITRDTQLEKPSATILVDAILQAFPSQFVQAQAALYEYLNSDIFFNAKLEKIALDHNILDIYKQIIFSRVIENIALKNTQSGSLPQSLQSELGVDQSTAMRATADILDFLETLNQTETSSTTTERQPVEVTRISETNQSDLAVELAETEAAFKQLQPIRTMAHDMETIKQEEPVHQAASQETILNGQGNAVKNTQAQWGTPEK